MSVRGVFADPALVEPCPSAEVVDPLEDQVQRDGQVRHERGMAILRDASHPGRDDLPGLRACELGVVDPDGPRLRAAHPGEHVDELGLAVAGHSSDTQDLAGRDVEGDRSQRIDPGAGDAQVADAEQRPVAVGGPVGHVVRRAAIGRPTIIRASSRSSVSPAAVPTSEPFRSTLTRSLMARTSPSLWLMKTTPSPSATRRSQRREQRSDLLGDEHRGRLVENEHATVPGQRLEDLDTLLLADRQVADTPLWIDRDPVARGGIRDTSPVPPHGRTGTTIVRARGSRRPSSGARARSAASPCRSPPRWHPAASGWRSAARRPRSPQRRAW